MLKIIEHTTAIQVGKCMLGTAVIEYHHIPDWFVCLKVQYPYFLGLKWAKGTKNKYKDKFVYVS